MQFYGEISVMRILSQEHGKALTQLWQRYPQLKYQTQLQSWKPENAIVAETVTSITGAQSRDRIRFSGQPLSHGSAMK